MLYSFNRIFRIVSVRPRRTCNSLKHAFVVKHIDHCSVVQLSYFLQNSIRLAFIFFVNKGLNAGRREGILQSICSRRWMVRSDTFNSISGFITLNSLADCVGLTLINLFRSRIEFSANFSGRLWWLWCCETFIFLVALNHSTMR